MNQQLDRRRFLRLAGALGAGCALPACGPSAPAHRYGEDDVARLAQQRAAEQARRAAPGAPGTRFRGYRGLAELPWFELDAQGELVMVADDVPPAVDCHCHFGISLLLAPELDLFQRTDRVEHLLDCDAEPPGCELDLDIYINGNFTPDELSRMHRGVIAQGLWGSRAAATQTIPNLLREMDATRVERAWILPIAFGFPFGDDLTERWLDAIEASGSAERFVSGASVHPGDPERIAKLERYAARGARVVKLHPPLQRFYPDADEMMEIYAACERLGLVVFFHCGRAGIEPERNHPYALPRHYAGALANFPKLPFVLGHSGARDADAALELALAHDNAWLDVHGQGLAHLGEMLRRTGGERMLFGTDWPFYHLASSLAKVLIATDGRPDLRDAVLQGNMERLLPTRRSPSAAT